jgi:hypothetical protein
MRKLMAIYKSKLVSCTRLRLKTNSQVNGGTNSVFASWFCSEANYVVCRKDCVALPAVQAFMEWMRVQAVEIERALEKFLKFQSP